MKTRFTAPAIVTRLGSVVLIVAALVGEAPAGADDEAGRRDVRWALYVTLAPDWFDPGEITRGFLTPFWVLYALLDFYARRGRRLQRRVRTRT
jgi:hypothetical protein